MRIIDFEWQDLFTSLILSRGKNYYFEGRVSRIQRINNTFIAKVAGTVDYEVELCIEDNKVKEMLCSCPYADTDNCKHMAAVMLALEKEEIPIEVIQPYPQPKIVSHVPMGSTWLDAVDRLPAEVLRKELMKLADRDERLKERLSALHLKKLPEGQIQNWKADLQETAAEYMDRRGRISGEEVWEFADDLCNFMNAKLPLLLEVNAVMDAFHVVWIVLETALEWHVIDEDGDLDDLFEECEENLRKLYSIMTDEQKQQMTVWYQEHRNSEWPGGVAILDQIFQALKECEVTE